MLRLLEWEIHKMNMTAPHLRPNHIEDALVKMHDNQWFGWTDSKNKIYANLKLSEKIGVNGNLVDNTVTELPTESAVNAKLKELQDAWDAANGRRIDGIHRKINREWHI
jgi:hypothetical protein